jgi:Cys-rich four helix bundle protein (predicted Tat secretion target)
MNRREVLDLVTAAGLMSIGAAAVDAGTPPASQMQNASGMHDHAAMSGKYATLVAATSKCVNTGDICLNHCLTMLGQGDKELAACAMTVRDTIAACTALRELAAANSPHVAALAKVVGDVCRDCKAECDKHEKHQVCRECGEACAQCAKECDRVAA